MGEITLKHVEEELRRLPAKRLRQVLLFVQFLEHIEEQGEELDGEDQDLWNAVLAHQQYRSEHSDETPEVFDTPDSFLKATKNW
ncbi:MAG: hypothetical protein M1132_05435 [Chloroflexi bacterium]|nr:hypothetical protein [Chloroflexota bacterium]